MAWIDNLSPGAAQFWGALAGASVGLVAILLGALFNAWLNRRRDDRLRDQEARSVAASLRAELGSLRVAIDERMKIWKSQEKHFEEQLAQFPERYGGSVDLGAYGELPPAPIPLFEANADKLGLLGAGLAGAVSVVYSNYRIQAAATAQLGRASWHELPLIFSQQIKWGEKLHNDCLDIEALLKEFETTGKPPRLA